MATKHKTSDKDFSHLPSGFGFKVGIVVSKWNKEITENLYSGAYETLQKLGVREMDIIRFDVPGSIELPLAAQWMIEHKKTDAVICLGSVIQGETKHFDYVCQSTASGIKDVSLKHNRPVIFGVLTDENIQQSKARSGGKLGNKGIDAAIAAVQMADLHKQLIN